MADGDEHDAEVCLWITAESFLQVLDSDIDLLDRSAPEAVNVSFVFDVLLESQQKLIEFLLGEWYVGKYLLNLLFCVQDLFICIS